MLSLCWCCWLRFFLYYDITPLAISLSLPLRLRCRWIRHEATPIGWYAADMPRRCCWLIAIITLLSMLMLPIFDGYNIDTTIAAATRLRFSLDTLAMLRWLPISAVITPAWLMLRQPHDIAAAFITPLRSPFTATHADSHWLPLLLAGQRSAALLPLMLISPPILLRLPLRYDAAPLMLLIRRQLLLRLRRYTHCHYAAAAAAATLRCHIMLLVITPALAFDTPADAPCHYCHCYWPLAIILRRLAWLTACIHFDFRYYDAAWCFHIRWYADTLYWLPHGHAILMSLFRWPAILYLLIRFSMVIIARHYAATDYCCRPADYWLFLPPASSL